MPLISITCSNDDLYNERLGIFTNYMEDGEEWERQAHVTMFYPDGTVFVDQGVGLSLVGDTSRTAENKSLKLNADLKYDSSQSYFNIEFLNNGGDVQDRSFVEKYGSLRLRAGSQDYTRGINARFNMVSELADEINFDGCASAQNCIVYLNGNFYYIMDMIQPYSQSYIADRFGLDNSEYVTIISGLETDVFQNVGIYDLFKADLNDQANREMLESRVDMDNYLLYYAFEIMLNNTDWPQNNFDIWCYQGENNPANLYSDGRFRFLLHDTDLIYYTQGNEVFFDGCTDDTFRNIMNGEVRGYDCSLVDVLKSEYYREKFIVILCDLMNTAFTTENIISVLENEYTYMLNETINYYDNSKQFLFLQPLYYELIREAITQRNNEIENDIEEYFQLCDKYILNLNNAKGISLQWNNIQLFQEDTYKCNYYAGVGPSIVATEYPGYKFCYWLVNGQKYYSNILKITSDMVKNNKCDVTVVSIPVEEGKPVISRISAKGDSDWIIVSNCGSGELMCSQYYLTDDIENLRKYQLPELNLSSGESIKIYGKNNYYILEEYICNFSLKNGETLYLTNGVNTLDDVPIPKMGVSESYGKYDDSSVMKYFREVPQTFNRSEWQPDISIDELFAFIGYEFVGNILNNGARWSSQLEVGTHYSQFFEAEYAHCNGVLLKFANYSNENQGGVRIQFYDVLTGMLCGEGYLTPDMIGDNQTVWCPAEAEFVPGNQYEMRITIDDEKGNCLLILYITNEDTQTDSTYAVLDGEVQNYCVNMMLTYVSDGAK